jgi:hypothetical protein
MRGVAWLSCVDRGQSTGAHGTCCVVGQNWPRMAAGAVATRGPQDSVVLLEMLCNIQTSNISFLRNNHIALYW